MNQRASWVRGRLAPSPTGALHLGNARSFLVAWLSARAKDGAVVFRIEDLDHPRVKVDATQQAMDDLRWLGLDWDEGPDLGGHHAPYIQSQRTDRYRAALNELLQQNLVYPCICSRKDVEEAQAAPHETADGLYYPGTCRDRFAGWTHASSTLSEERLPAWRFRVSEGSLTFRDTFHGSCSYNVFQQVGDFAIARHEDGAGYMLAVVVDDTDMGITEIVRGDDLLPATPRQILLYRALNVPIPSFTHIPLVVGPDGRRLAKRHGDTRISALREAGTSPQRIMGMLAHWCGWGVWGEELTPYDVLKRYDLTKLPRQPVVLTEEACRFLGC